MSRFGCNWARQDLITDVFVIQNAFNFSNTALQDINITQPVLRINTLEGIGLVARRVMTAWRSISERLSR
jgi:hypothetical protein